MEPTGRARVNANDPRAFAVCDRCGTWHNWINLSWQYEWSGTRLFNTNLLVCQRCLDVPNEQLRTIILPPDPVAIQNARLEPFQIDNEGPVSSQIAQDADLGATTIYVQDVTGFEVGQTVYVQLNNSTFAQETIVSIDSNDNSMVVSIPLPYPASTLGVVSA